VEKFGIDALRLLIHSLSMLIDYALTQANDVLTVLIIIEQIQVSQRRNHVIALYARSLADITMWGKNNF
jgi:hypothetical protein